MPVAFRFPLEAKLAVSLIELMGVLPKGDERLGTKYIFDLLTTSFSCAVAWTLRRKLAVSLVGPIGVFQRMMGVCA